MYYIMDSLVYAESLLRSFSTMNLDLLDCLAIATCTLIVLGVWKHQRRDHKLPPGPSIKLFGNAHHVPQKKHWQAYKKFADQYGTHKINLFPSAILTTFQLCEKALAWFAFGCSIAQQLFWMTTRLPVRFLTGVRLSTRVDPPPGWAGY